MQFLLMEMSVSQSSAGFSKSQVSYPEPAPAKKQRSFPARLTCPLWLLLLLVLERDRGGAISSLSRLRCGVADLGGGSVVDYFVPPPSVPPRRRPCRAAVEQGIHLVCSIFFFFLFGITDEEAGLSMWFSVRFGNPSSSSGPTGSSVPLWPLLDGIDEESNQIVPFLRLD